MKTNQLPRLVTNYLRLFTTFIAGLLIVRILLDFSSSVYAIYVLITVGFGVSILIRELLRIALTPWISDILIMEQRASRIHLGHAITLCAIAALVGVAILFSVAGNLKTLGVPRELINETQIFAGARAAQLFVVVSFVPGLILLMLTQRFVLSNLLQSIERIVEVIVLSSLAEINLGLFGWISCALTVASYLLIFGSVFLYDKRFRPLWGPGFRVNSAKVFSYLGWSAALVVAINLYLRFDTVFISMTAGTIAIVAFGLAVQVTGMLRQLTFGISSGLDAVLSRLLTNHAAPEGRAELIAFSAELQAIIGFSTSGILISCGPALLRVWLGSPAEAPLDLAYILILALLPGTLIVSFAEVWLTAATANRKLGSYVRVLILLSFANPLILLTYGMVSSSSGIPLVSAILYSALQALAYMVFLPKRMAKIIGTTPLNLMRPYARPFIAISLTCLFVSTLFGDVASRSLHDVTFIVLFFGIIAFVLVLRLLSKFPQFRI